MTRDGHRPVEVHLVEFFKQNQTVQVSATEMMYCLRKLGFKHCIEAVRDNLAILVERGFLVQNDGHFSMAPDGANIDLEPPFKQPRARKPYEHHKPKQDCCDRCGRHFEQGDDFHPIKFSNITLTLCEDCYVLKVPAK